MRDSLVEKTYEWDLVSSPAALWPILSDTARLNEALGLPLYAISETFDSNSHRRRYGEMVEDGSQIRWEEPQFEWVENGWWRWRRFYDEGPLRETGGILMLLPTSNGGTHVNYSLGVEPNGTLGRLLIASGHLKSAARGFEKLTKEIDAHCRNPLGDFYSNFAAKTAKKAKKQPPELPKAKDAESALLTQFAEWLKIAPRSDRLDLRSRRLARCLGVRESEALRACLLAVRSGDLVMRYRAVCPSCRASAIEVPKLGDIPALLACRGCGAGYHRDLAGSVEVLFSVANADPEQGTYCGSGPNSAPHVPIQQRLGGLERRDLEFKLPAGIYSVRAKDGPVSEMVELTENNGLHVQITDGGVLLQPGGESCSIENHCKRDYDVSVERCDWPADALPVADLLAEQCFWDLLPDHILPDGDSAAIGFGVVLGIGDLPGALTTERGGALIEQEDGYLGLVFSSLKLAMTNAEHLRKQHPDARFALDCGALTVSTRGGRMEVVGVVPENARSFCMSGYRGQIVTSPHLKDTLNEVGLPIPDTKASRVPA